MDEKAVQDVMRDLLREQLRCIGRISARHALPDDAVWEIVKGFEILYRRVCRGTGQAAGGPVLPEPRRMLPHPGLTYLLGKLEREGRSAETAVADAS